MIWTAGSADFAAGCTSQGATAAAEAAAAGFRAGEAVRWPLLLNSRWVALERAASSRRALF